MTPPVDGLDDLSYGRRRTDRHCLWMALSTSMEGEGLVGTACGWTNRLLLWTEKDWSAPPVDGLVNFSYGRRRTGRHRLWMDWSTSPMDGGLVGTACGWTGQLLLWTEKDRSALLVHGLVNFSYGRRTGRHRLWMDWSTSPMDGGLVGTACGWTGQLLLWTDKDRSAPPVDGLVNFSYGRKRTGRHRLWMDWSTSPMDGGLVGTACGWTGRLFQWTEDWSAPPVDGLVDFSNGRRTGRHRLWMDWSTFPVEGGLVDFSNGRRRTGPPLLWTEDNWSAPKTVFVVKV